MNMCEFNCGLNRQRLMDSFWLIELDVELENTFEISWPPLGTYIIWNFESVVQIVEKEILDGWKIVYIIRVGKVYPISICPF